MQALTAPKKRSRSTWPTDTRGVRAFGVVWPISTISLSSPVDWLGAAYLARFFSGSPQAEDLRNALKAYGFAV